MRQFKQLEAVGAEVNGRLVLSASHVDSAEKMEELKRLFPGNAPISITQLHTVEREWGFVDDFHRLAFSETYSGQFLHLAMPVDPIFLLQPKPMLIEKQREMLERIPHLLNMEAWVHYFARYSELLENALAGFHSAAAELFTLQAHCKDLQHEVRSSLLLQIRNRLRGSLQESAKAKSYKELLDLEKSVVKDREELYSAIAAHAQVLGNIQATIPMIKMTHPELRELFRVGSLLHALMGYQLLEGEGANWAREQLLLELLNDAFEIPSVILGPRSGGRAHLLLAVRLSLGKLLAQEGKEAASSFVLAFDQGHPLIDRFQGMVYQTLEGGATQKKSTVSEGTPMLNPAVAPFFAEEIDPQVLYSLTAFGIK